MPVCVPQLDMSNASIDAEGAKALAATLAASTSLTSVNLLRNNLDGDSATLLSAAAKQKGISLCGIAPDQTKADFARWGLGPADAILVAHDLYVRASLTQVLAFSPNLTQIC